MGLAVVSTMVAAPAYASAGTITCTGWTYTTYTPGLTDTATPTTVVDQGNLNVIGEHSPTGNCLAIGSSASAGQRDVTAQLDVGCTQFIVETVILETGTVTSGEFSGDNVIETFTAPNTGFLACGTVGGVTALDFATVIAITI